MTNLIAVVTAYCDRQPHDLMTYYYKTKKALRADNKRLKRRWLAHVWKHRMSYYLLSSSTRRMSLKGRKLYIHIKRRAAGDIMFERMLINNHLIKQAPK